MVLKGGKRQICYFLFFASKCSTRILYWSQESIQCWPQCKSISAFAAPRYQHNLTWSTLVAHENVLKLLYRPTHNRLACSTMSLFQCDSNVGVVCNVAAASCAGDELSMNSKCYRKYHGSRTWFNASNECLSRGGSLAVFTNTGRPSDNNRLTEWLNASGADKTYWIGLIRSWWRTTDEGVHIYNQA